MLSSGPTWIPGTYMVHRQNVGQTRIHTNYKNNRAAVIIIVIIMIIITTVNA